MEEQFTSKADPAIVLSYESKVGPDRALRFQTAISVDCSPKELSALVDKLRNEADRQDASLTLDLLKAQYASEEKMLEKIRWDVKRVSEEYARQWHNSGKKGPYTASVKEKKALESINHDMEIRELRLKELKEKMKQCEEKLGWLDLHQPN